MRALYLPCYQTLLLCTQHTKIIISIRRKTIFSRTGYIVLRWNSKNHPLHRNASIKEVFTFPDAYWWEGWFLKTCPTLQKASAEDAFSPYGTYSTNSHENMDAFQKCIRESNSQPVRRRSVSENGFLIPGGFLKRLPVSSNNSKEDSNRILNYLVHSSVPKLIMPSTLGCARTVNSPSR